MNREEAIMYLSENWKENRWNGKRGIDHLLKMWRWQGF